MQDGGSFWDVAEMRMATSAGGSNICLPGGDASPYTALFSSFFNSDYTAGHAFNNNLHGVVSPGSPSSPWGSASEAIHWLGMDFGALFHPAVREFKIWCRSDSLFGTSPTSITFQHSDDGVLWADVITYSGLTWTINNATEADAHIFAIPPDASRRQLINPF